MELHIELFVLLKTPYLIESSLPDSHLQIAEGIQKYKLASCFLPFSVMTVELTIKVLILHIKFQLCRKFLPLCKQGFFDLLTDVFQSTLVVAFQRLLVVLMRTLSSHFRCAFGQIQKSKGDRYSGHDQ